MADGAAPWLSAVPLDALNLALDRQSFRDAIALRMGVDPPELLPQRCPDCGEAFSVSHAMKCHNGGWVRSRHGEVLREWKKLMKKVCDSVVEEPLVPMPQGIQFQKKTTTTDKGARADILARGLLRPQQNNYFDVVVIDTAKASRLDRSVSATLREAESKKRAMYEERVRHCGGTFTPLACSVYGTLAPEAAEVLSMVTRRVAARKDERPDVSFALRVKLHVAILRATSLCLRVRSHRTPESPSDPEEMEDGAGGEQEEGELEGEDFGVIVRELRVDTGQ